MASSKMHATGRTQVARCVYELRRKLRSFPHKLGTGIRPQALSLFSLLGDFATIIMAALSADVMWAFQITAIGAF
jgi:hypothetical protein